MFTRPHHQLIAQILLALDGSLLREHKCLFGGGTAIALRYGEYRESVDLDFLVSDLTCYRQLRLLTADGAGRFPLFRGDLCPHLKVGPVRADQYGIRTQLFVAEQPVKFEIVLEGRIQLQSPGLSDKILGIATLTPLDMLTGKLLANADRWADESVFGRDLIDLAMMQPTKSLLREAVVKAEQAYGEAIVQDVVKAIEKFKYQPHWLEHCTKAMEIDVPKALLWERIRMLRRKLPDV